MHFFQTQKRWRTCNVAQGTGSPDVCTAPKEFTKDCNLRKLRQVCTNDIMISYEGDRVDGSWGAWMSWSSSHPLSCPGQRYQQRVCKYPFPTCRGNICPGENIRCKSISSKFCAEMSFFFGVRGIFRGGFRINFYK